MEKSAKLFTNGRSQAVRIPAEFRIKADSVFIRQQPNGDLVISRYSQQDKGWDAFFLALDGVQVTDDFLSEHERNDAPAERDPFEGMD